jgi:hypothetical protein
MDDDITTTITTSSSKPKPFEFKKRSVVGSTSSSFRRKKKQQLVVESSSAKNNNAAAAADDECGTDVPVTIAKPDAAQNTGGGSEYSSSNKNNNDNNSFIDNDENDEDENDDSHSALDAVLAIERRRKLLLGRRSRGVDAASLTSSSSMTKRGVVTNNNSTSSVQHGGGGGGGGGNSEQKSYIDLEERLMGGRTFAGGRSAGSNNMGGSDDGDDGGGVLAMKHKMAMEEFIRKNLHEKQDRVVGDSAGHPRNASTSDSAERELYAELFLSTEINNDGKGSNVSDDEGDGATAKRMRGDEGDVGAGGAVMGGTGIAEVALPIDERLRAARATEMAALEWERARMAKRNHYDGGVGVDVGGPSSALPNHDMSNNLLGASYSHNFQLHTKEWVSRRRDERQIEIDALRSAHEATEGNTTIENRARVGFEAARKSAKLGERERTNAPTTSASGYGSADTNNDPSMRNEWDRKQGGDARSNDERVWRTFMTKQRNRR